MKNFKEKIKKIFDPESDEGQIIMTTVVGFILIFLVIVLGMTTPALRHSKLIKETFDSKQSYSLAESGDEDVAFRIRTARQYSDEEVLSLGGFFATTTVSDDLETGGVSLLTIADVADFIRKKSLSLISGDTVTFNYGVQIGPGGISMHNSSFITGNVYSEGPIISDSDNLINGTAVSVGPDGLIDGAIISGDGIAHTINDSEIEGDAYYQVITDSVVDGQLHPDTPDAGAEDFPISDETLDQWEQVAAEAGSIPCLIGYNPFSGGYDFVLNIDRDVTIGPGVIDCDVIISGTPEITLAGSIWIKGSLQTTNSPVINLDPGLGSKSIAVIVDRPTDRLTSSKIILRNTTSFWGTGQEGSSIMLVSRNNSAEVGGDEVAIEMRNSVQGDLLLYTNHGMVTLANSISIDELTSYGVTMRNSSELVYEEGLASHLFETGPGGGWDLSGWFEVE